MNYVKSTFVGAIVAVTSSMAWGQADPRISIVAVPTPDKVTLSRPAGQSNLPLDTFAAFRVTFANGARSALNRVFLNGTATNVGGTDTVEFDSFIAVTNPSDTCVGTAPNAVSCSLASLSPGAVTEFIVIFKAPVNGARIDFNWTAGGAEGNGNGNGCCSQAGLAQTTLVDPSTDPSFKTEAKTFVRPQVGGTVFTGSEAITTPSDGWSTTVVVPSFTLPVGADPVAKINEFSSADVAPPVTLACPSYSTSSTCFATTLSIPGTFESLQIKIRLDKSFFSLGKTKPETLSLLYTGDGAPPAGTFYPHTLKLCSQDAATFSLPISAMPLAGRPCMSEPPKILPNGHPIKDLRSDLEFNVRARDNGRYSQ